MTGINELKAETVSVVLFGPHNANQIRKQPCQEDLTWIAIQGQESASLEISKFVHVCQLTAKIACFNMAFHDCVGECQELLTEAQLQHSQTLRHVHDQANTDLSSNSSKLDAKVSMHDPVIRMNRRCCISAQDDVVCSPSEGSVSFTTSARRGVNGDLIVKFQCIPQLRTSSRTHPCAERRSQVVCNPIIRFPRLPVSVSK